MEFILFYLFGETIDYLFFCLAIEILLYFNLLSPYTLLESVFYVWEELYLFYKFIC